MRFIRRRANQTTGCHAKVPLYERRFACWLVYVIAGVGSNQGGAVPNAYRVLLTLCIVLIAGASSNVTAQTIGSQAELWYQRPPPQKLAYLEGFCEGVGNVGQSDALNLGKLTCEPIARAKKSKSLDDFFRFCGMTSSNGGRGAIKYLDGFYRDNDHSDVPLWAAVASYNDRKCGETNVQGRLPVIQAKGKCIRQLSILMQSGVSKAVVDKQMEECGANR
jgi:hypothetical protein